MCENIRSNNGSINKMGKIVSKMREKIVDSVRKLMNAEIKAWKVHTYFNVHVVKIVFFGCGIISLTDDECEELQRIHEMLLLAQ